MPEKLPVIAQYGTEPSLVHYLRNTDGTTPDMCAVTDTVAMRMSDWHTAIVDLSWVDATITDGATGEVTYAWDSSADTSVPGMKKCQWRVTRTTGAQLYIRDAFSICIRRL